MRPRAMDVLVLFTVRVLVVDIDGTRGQCPSNSEHSLFAVRSVRTEQCEQRTPKILKIPNSATVRWTLPGDMNFDPVKYVKETLSRGDKLTLLHFFRSLIGRNQNLIIRSKIFALSTIRKSGAKLIFRHVIRSLSYTLLDQS